MFNLLPGQGLGFHANKLLAWGLGYWEALVVEVFKLKSRFEESAFAIQIREEDEEILMILKAFLFMKEN